MPSSGHQKRGVESLGQQIGLGLEPARVVHAPQPLGATRRQELGAVDVALHLGQRDRAFRQTAVGMEDGVLGILPALVGEPLLGRAVVFDEAVAVGIAGPVDPGERGLDGGPQIHDGGVVAGALGIETRQHDEQRRGIDAAVIKAERHLAQGCHLAFAHLVQDLSRLRVRGRIVGLGLERGEAPQHALRDARIEPEHLQRGDQSVAAERGRIPGDAGIGITPLRRVGHQHVEVGHRPAQHLVEEVVRGLDRGGVVRHRAQIAVDRAQPAQERHRLRRFRRAAADGAANRRELLRRNAEAIGHRRRGELARGRIEAQDRLPQLGVEALIAQHGGGGARHLAVDGAAALAPQAADLEQVGEVAVEQHGQAQIDRTFAVVLDRQPLIGRVAPEKNRAHDVQGVLRQHQVIVEIHVGIGQIDRQQRVVVAQVGAEQQRLHPVEQQLEMREKTRVAVEQAVGAAGRRADVAVAVEHDEGVVVLERTARPRGRTRRWNIERRLRNCVERQFRERDALDRHETSISSFPVQAPAGAATLERPAPAAPAA